MLLAQATPAAADLKIWIEVLVYIAVGVAAVAHAAKLFTGKSAERTITPQPLEVREHTKLASQSDLDQVHGRIKRERMELEEKIAALQTEDLRLREKLDEDISNLRKEIQDVPAQTISLLRVTKGLIG